MHIRKKQGRDWESTHSDFYPDRRVDAIGSVQRILRSQGDLVDDGNRKRQTAAPALGRESVRAVEAARDLGGDPVWAAFHASAPQAVNRDPELERLLKGGTILQPRNGEGPDEIDGFVRIAPDGPSGDSSGDGEMLPLVAA